VPAQLFRLACHHEGSPWISPERGLGIREFKPESWHRDLLDAVEPNDCQGPAFRFSGQHGIRNTSILDRGFSAWHCLTCSS